MQNITEAMTGVMASVKTNDSENLITSTLIGLDEQLVIISDHIIESWNIIESNEMKRQIVIEFIHECLQLSSVSERFDHFLCDNPDIFSNAWLGREYYILICRTMNLLQPVIKHYQGQNVIPNNNRKVFSGLARSLRPYFNGPSDTDLERLIVNHQAFARRYVWRGQRNEATIFGKLLGLECREMNASFIFLRKNGNEAPLNYSQDAPAFLESEYPIYGILSNYII